MKKMGIVDSGESLTKGIGAMDEARVKDFYDKMVKAGLYKTGEVDLSKVVTTQFVNKGVGVDVCKSSPASKHTDFFPWVARGLRRGQDAGAWVAIRHRAAFHSLGSDPVSPATQVLSEPALNHENASRPLPSEPWQLQPRALSHRPRGTRTATPRQGHRPVRRGLRPDA